MSSNIDLAKAVGVELDVEPVRIHQIALTYRSLASTWCGQVAWNARDLLLYAVGIGAKKDDLALVYGAHIPSELCVPDSETRCASSSGLAELG